MNNLNDYLDMARSPYHVVSYITKKLEAAGFAKLTFGEDYKLEAGKRYYVSPYPTSLFAFVMPENKAKGFHIACAHTDYPTFKVKPVADMGGNTGNCRKINVEPYGGMLKRTWFDRPLGVAGLVVARGDNVYEPRTMIFDSEKPWMCIPSLAPHMDRDIEKKDIDPAKELVPVISLCDEDDASFLDVVAKKLSKDCGADITAKDILSYDLGLYDTTKAESVGVNDEFLVSGRIDNIASVAALTESIIAKASAVEKDSEYISLIALFDNEEVGSRTKQGADSNLLHAIVDRICGSFLEFDKMLADSLMLSVDGAHGLHPNYPEKADTTATAVLGKGVVIKTSASQRYVSDPVMLGIVRGICETNDIPYQVQANRSGTPGGQTLGPIASSYLPVRAIDMGVPMLGMHSVREMIADRDYDALENLVKSFL